MKAANIAALILLVSLSAEASPPVDETYEKWNTILKEAGASTDEANILITIAVAEMAGTQNIEKACSKWGCDNGTSFSVWQIQCRDKPGKSWKDNKWLWYLREKLNIPDLSCKQLNADDMIAAKSALTILRAFGKQSTINLMMKWGTTNNPQKRRSLLQAIHHKVIVKRAQGA